MQYLLSGGDHQRQQQTHNMPCILHADATPHAGPFVTCATDSGAAVLTQQLQLQANCSCWKQQPTSAAAAGVASNPVAPGAAAAAASKPHHPHKPHLAQCLSFLNMPLRLPLFLRSGAPPLLPCVEPSSTEPGPAAISEGGLCGPPWYAPPEE